VLLVAPTAHGTQVNNDLAWILLAFAIFNTYMLLFSVRVNMAVMAVFLTLEITEVVLFVGNFANNASIVKTGGYIGVLTALVAWYASAAGVINGMAGSALLWVGNPLGTGRGVGARGILPSTR
jgi:succinate-acetate transporter protein